MSEIEDNLIKGFAAYQAGKLDDAEQHCAASLAANPLNAVALHLHGLIQMERGNPDAAAALMLQAIEIDETKPFFHSNLGFVLLRSGKAREAAFPFQRALELQPSYEQARRGLAQAAAADAMTSQPKPLASGASEVEEELSKGFSDYQASQLDSAEQRCNRVLGSQPENPGGWHLLGLISVARGNFEAGLAAITRGFTFGDSKSSYRFNLGFLLLERGRREEAAAQFKRALELEPTLWQAHNGLAQSLMPGAHYTEMLAHFHETLRPKLYVEIGVCDGNSLRLAKSDTKVVAIDPEPLLREEPSPNVSLFRVTSDAFFQTHDLAEIGSRPSFDLAFIDGLHHFDQVLRDFINLERYSAPDSLVLIHDCFPIDAVTSSRYRTSVFWTGDVWKIVPLLRAARPDLDVITIGAVPSGLAVVGRLNRDSTLLQERYEQLVAEYFQMPFSALEPNRDALLGVVPADWDAVWQRCKAMLPDGHQLRT